MSTKHSHRKKNLLLAYSVFFNLTVEQADGTLRKIKARLSLETLSLDEQQAINDNVELIAHEFYEVLAPHLNLDTTSLAQCERRMLTSKPTFTGDK